jgi:hypothetical protein
VLSDFENSDSFLESQGDFSSSKSRPGQEDIHGYFLLSPQLFFERLVII